MNKEKFLEYTSDPDKASMMAANIDVGGLHIGLERMISRRRPKYYNRIEYSSYSSQ